MSDQQLGAPPNTFTTNPLSDSPDAGTDGRRGSAGSGKTNRRNRRSLKRLFKMPLTKIETDVDDLQLPVQPEDRKMTDLLFFILFLAYWVGMVGLAIVGFRSGDPASLLYGTDSLGRTCGGKNEDYDDPTNTSLKDLSDQKFVVFPTVEEDSIISDALGLDNPLDISFFAICAEACPQENEYVCSPETTALVEDASDDLQAFVAECFDDSTSDLCDTVVDSCYRSLFNQTSFFFRCFPEYLYEVTPVVNETFCLEFEENPRFGDPECLKFQDVKQIKRIEPPQSNLLFDAYNSFSRVFDRLMSDTLNAGDVILYCGILVAILTGFFYIILLRYVVGYVIWGTVLITIAGLAGLTAYLYAKAGLLTDESIDSVTDVFGQNLTVDFSIEDEVSQSDDYKTEYEIAAYVCTAFLLILVFIVASIRKRINKAIMFFKQASKAINANPSLLSIPFISVTMSGLVIAFCVSLLLFLYTSSSGDVNSAWSDTQISMITERFGVNNTAVGERLEQGSLENSGTLLTFVLLGWLWTIQVVSGIGFITVSFVVGTWYWKSGDPTPEEEEKKKGCDAFGFKNLRKGFGTVMKYHIGTVAFGGLLIAFVQLVRYIAAFLQARANGLKGKSKIVKILLLSLNCCLKCAENCIKFISHNAFIMTMLYGVGFCEGTKMAFSAFAHNLVQVATVTFLGDIILRFGQLLITCIAAFAAYVTLDSSPEYQIGGDEELSSIVWPVFLTIVLAWLVSAQVMNVYKVSIDTILLSWCQDRKLQDKKKSGASPRARRNSVGRFVNANKPVESEFIRQKSLAVNA